MTHLISKLSALTPPPRTKLYQNNYYSTSHIMRFSIQPSFETVKSCQILSIQKKHVIVLFPSTWRNVKLLRNHEGSSTFKKAVKVSQQSMHHKTGFLHSLPNSVQGGNLVVSIRSWDTRLSWTNLCEVEFNWIAACDKLR